MKTVVRLWACAKKCLIRKTAENIGPVTRKIRVHHRYRWNNIYYNFVRGAINGKLGVKMKMIIDILHRKKKKLYMIIRDIR